MLFQELGTLLKEKRESRGVSPEEIAEKLKIPLKGIYAIEEGNKEALPHEIYIRTFIKGYASYVGYSEEEIDEIFAKVDDFSDASATKKNNNSLVDFESKSKSRGGKYFAILFIIAALGGGGYWYVTQESPLQNSVNSGQSFWGSEESNEDTPLPQSDTHQENNNDLTKNGSDSFDENSENRENLNEEATETSSESSANNTSEDIGSEVITENEQNSVTAEDSAEKSEVVAESQTTEENTAEEDTPLITQALATSMSAGSDSFEVNLDTPLARRINWQQVQKVEKGQQQAVIHVSQDCWMSVKLDGKTTHFTLKKNNQRDFIFKQTAQFQFGNASAVTLFHNGKPVQTGDSSELRVVKLSR